MKYLLIGVMTLMILYSLISLLYLIIQDED